MGVGVKVVLFVGYNVVFIPLTPTFLCVHSLKQGWNEEQI